MSALDKTPIIVWHRWIKTEKVPRVKINTKLSPCLPVGVGKDGLAAMYRITQKLSCDVLVLGAGGAGLTAAVRAAQSGRQVIVLEKTEHPGGSMGYANFTRVFDSCWQAERGLVCRTADYLRAVQDRADWQFRPALASAAVRTTGVVFDWLTDMNPALGEEVVVGKYIFPAPFEPEGPQSPRGAEKNLGTLAQETLLAACERYDVPVMTGCEAVDAETEDGALTAVIAMNEHGYMRIACGACVIATGSWSANRKLVAELCPQFDPRTQDMTPHIDRTMTGDGLVIAQAAGAELDRAGMCMHFIRTTGIRRDPVLRTLMRSPAQITVNVNGERFCSEPISRLGRSGGGFIQMAQPYGISYCVFDRDSLQAACTMPPVEPDNLERTYDRTELPENADELIRLLEGIRREEPKTVFRGESLEELADCLGVDKPVFLNTVRDYNDCCETGSDPDFVKTSGTMVPLRTAPFYAVRVTADLLGATGGVKIDEHMRVVDADGEPIAGLYAAGDIASGGSLRNGSEEIRLLNSLAWALSGGYMAGTEAAELAETLCNSHVEVT